MTEYGWFIEKQNHGEGENKQGRLECSLGGWKFLGSPSGVVMLSPVTVLYQDSVQKMTFSGP